MTLRVRVTQQADREINHIADWYAIHDAEIGGKWLAGVYEAITSLAEDPQRFALAHEADDVVFEIRELLYGVGRRKTHRILFRIKENIVEILAVRHAAQDDFDSSKS